MSTSVNSVGNYQPPASTGSTGATLGKDDFLNLLVAQLRYQDPLDPMKGTEFAAQLAQFSSVEQLSNINTTLTQNLDATNLLSQGISNSLAATLIGKDIRATGSSFTFTGTSNAKIGYSLSSQADSATVKILDVSGNVVRTMAGTGTSKGDNTLSWDGKDDWGNSVGAGTYKFTVDAKNADGSTDTASPYVFGTVTAVRFKSDGAVFVVDGVEIPTSGVLEITGG